LKKIIVGVTLFTIVASYSSERTKSPKPYAHLGQFVSPGNNPLTIDDIVERIKTLVNSVTSDIPEEINRYTELSQLYNKLCNNFRTRGKKPEYDKCYAQASKFAQKAAELSKIQNELDKIDYHIGMILSDETLGSQPHRWVATRPLYKRMVQIIP